MPTHIWKFHNELRISYRTPLNGNSDGNELLVSIQGGVIHQFPNADDNPEGLDDPEILWKFFHKHPLPKELTDREVRVLQMRAFN